MDVITTRTLLFVFVLFSSFQWGSGQCDLNLTKIVNNPTPSISTDIVFTVTVSNDGPSDATGVEVMDELPSGYSFVSDTISQGNYNELTGIWTVGAIANGENATLKIRATVLSSGDYINIAEVTDADQVDVDSTPGNGADTDGDGTGIGSQDPDTTQDPDDEDDGDDAVVVPLCIITIIATDITFDDNDSGDPNDDTFGLTASLTNQNFGTGWTTTFDGQLSSGSYGVATELGPFSITTCEAELTFVDDDNANCTTTIAIVPSINVQAGDSPSICFGGSVLLQGMTTSASPAVTWSVISGDFSAIDNGQSTFTPTVSPLFNTTFEITASANGCTDSDFVTVTPDGNQNPWAIVNYDPCFGTDPLLLDGSTSQAPFSDPTAVLTYSWYDENNNYIGIDPLSDQTIEVSPIPVDAFSLIVSSQTTGCSDTARVTLSNITLDCTVELTLADSTVNAGEIVCLPVTVGSFSNVLGMQGSFAYYPAVATFVGVQNFNLPGLFASNFGTGIPGVITYSWTNPDLTGLSLPDDTVIFELCFSATSTTTIVFSDSPAPLEVVDGDENSVDLTTESGTITIDSPANGFALSFPSTTANEGDQFCLPLSVYDFNNILGMQFSTNYDPAILTFDNAQNLNLAGLVGANIANPSPGNIILSWTDPNVSGLSVADGTAILELCFTRISGDGCTTVGFSGSPTPIEITDGNENDVSFTGIPAQVCPGLTVNNTFLSFISNGDGTHRASYEVRVNNGSSETEVYRLVNSPLFDDDFEIIGGTYAGEEAGLLTTGENTLANDKSILAGEIQTYQLDFIITVNLEDGEGDDLLSSCNTFVGGAVSRGLNNMAVLDIDNDGIADQYKFACGNVPTIDLALELDSDNDNPVLNEEVVFAVGLRNFGQITATGIAVSIDLPDNFSFVSTDGNYDQGTEIWTVNDLTNGEITSLNITANVNALQEAVVTAEVTTANEIDRDSHPNNGVDTDNDGSIVDDPEDEDDGDGWALCFGSAGTITITQDTVCANEFIKWSDNGDAVLPTDFSVFVGIFDNEFQTNNPIRVTDTIALSLQGGLNLNQTYFLRPVIAPENMNNEAELQDDCTVWGEAQAIRWQRPVFENCEADSLLTCTQSTLNIDCSSLDPNMTYVWEFDGGIISNASSIEINVPGIYSLTLTDEFGCTNTEETIIGTDFAPPSFTVVQSGNLCANGELLLEPTVDTFEDYTYLWSNNESTSSISVATANEYCVTITDITSGCFASDCTTVELPAEECNYLTGTVYQASDCLLDGTEMPLSSWLVEIIGVDYHEFTYSTSNGSYSFDVSSGNYEVRLHPLSPVWVTCQQAYPVSFNGSAETKILDLLTSEADDCPLMEVAVDIYGILRPCEEDVTVCVWSYNVGTTSLEDGEITVILPERLSYNSTNGILLGMSGDSLVFQAQDLLPGQSNVFQVYVDVDCDINLIGTAMCIEAIGTPYGPCPGANSLWSGASLQVGAQCENNEVVFTFRNDGTETMTQNISYTVIEDFVMLMQQPDELPPLNGGEETTITFPANGSTYTIMADQEPFHPGFSMPTAVIEGCGLNEDGNISTGFVQQFPHDDLNYHVDEDCRIVTASFDPNDKQAEPIGYDDDFHYVEPETKLEYVIRFQNTGTDTAFLVVIRDTLDASLDVSTLRVGVSSHPYEVSIDSAHFLTFTFNDILLPDSTTNWDESQGFVEYNIKPKADTPLGTRIENRAGIYFDINEVVLTNTVFHTIEEHFIEIINWVSESGNDLALKVYPNPTNGFAKMELLGGTEGEKQLILYDVLGQEILNTPFFGNSLQLNLQHLHKGWYGMQLLDKKDQIIGAGKLIVR